MRRWLWSHWPCLYVLACLKYENETLECAFVFESLKGCRNCYLQTLQFVNLARVRSNRGVAVTKRTEAVGTELTAHIHQRTLVTLDRVGPFVCRIGKGITSLRFLDDFGNSFRDYWNDSIPRCAVVFVITWLMQLTAQQVRTKGATSCYARLTPHLAIIYSCWIFHEDGRNRMFGML